MCSGRGLTQGQRDEVVREHNKLRQEVASGRVQGQPRAAYMPNLVCIIVVELIATF